MSKVTHALRQIRLFTLVQGRRCVKLCYATERFVALPRGKVYHRATIPAPQWIHGHSTPSLYYSPCLILLRPTLSIKTNLISLLCSSKSSSVTISSFHSPGSCSPSTTSNSIISPNVPPSTRNWVQLLAQHSVLPPNLDSRTIRVEARRRVPALLYQEEFHLLLPTLSQTSSEKGRPRRNMCKWMITATLPWKRVESWQAITFQCDVRFTRSSTCLCILQRLNFWVCHLTSSKFWQVKWYPPITFTSFS